MFRVLALAGILIGVIGLFTLGHAAVRAIETWRGFPGWPRAQATIVRVYKESGSWHAVIRFENGGRVLTFDRNLQSGGKSAPLIEGRTMTVIYPSSHPERAFFDWKSEFSNAIWTDAILGAFLLIFGWILGAISFVRPMVEALPDGSPKRRRPRH